MEELLDKLILTAICLLSFSTSLMAVDTFGAGADKNKIVSISKLLETPTAYKGKEITVTGTIVSVCKNRGCWMKFASDKKYQTLRIKVQDGKMVFPVTLRGRKGYATGVLKGRQISEAQAKKWLGHMAKESGEPFNEANIKGPQMVYMLVPTGVTVE